MQLNKCQVRSDTLEKKVSQLDEYNVNGLPRINNINQKKRER